MVTVLLLLPVLSTFIIFHGWLLPFLTPQLTSPSEKGQVRLACSSCGPLLPQQPLVLLSLYAAQAIYLQLSGS